MSPQGWRQSVLALRVPSFNSSAKTCVQGMVTGAQSKSAADRINHVFHHGTKKRDFLCSALCDGSRARSFAVFFLFVSIHI